MKKLLTSMILLGGSLFMAGSVRGYETGCGNDPKPKKDCTTICGVTTCKDVTDSQAPGPAAGGGSPADVGSDSIKPLTANKERRVKDLETFGVASFNFSRIYGSRTTDFTTNYVEFGVKQTWQHNWNFEVRDQTATTNGHKHVKVRYPNGNELDFKAADMNGIVRVPPAFEGDRLYAWIGTNVGHTLVTPDGWEYDFERTTSPRYRLIRVRNGEGFSWRVSYATEHKISRIENDFGRWIEIDRGVTNGVECITRLRSSDGREVVYEYGTWFTGTATNTVLGGALYPDGTAAEYTYVGAQSLTNGRPLLASASDPMVPGAGARAQYEYNYNAIFDFGNGPYLVTGTTLRERSFPESSGGGSGGGGSTRVELPLGSGNYPQILEADGTELTRIYTNGVLTEERDGEGRPTYYIRDAGGLGYVIGIVDAESNVTSVVRDYAGRILQKVDPLGRTNRYAFNASGFLTNAIDPLGRTTTYLRDTNNFLIRVDYPDASYEEWTRNDYGQALSHRQQNGGTQIFSYYGTNEVGGLFGDLKEKTDALGHTTVYTWDSAGWMTSVQDAKSNQTWLSRNWRGLAVAITNADLTASYIQYDAYGNRTNVLDALGHATSFTYDENQRVSSVRDALGRVTSNEYGRLAASGCGSCGGSGATISRIITPDGKVTEYNYDQSNKRTNEIIAAGTSDAATNSWTYDAVGRLKTQRDAVGNMHVWAYDASGRVVAETNAAGEATSYSYDLAGNLISKTDGAGITTFWAYDVMNQTTNVGSGNLVYEYEYDLGGRRTAMRTRLNGAVTETTTYTYDLNDRMLTKTDPTGYVLNYTYDSLGNRTNLLVNSVSSVTSVVQQAYTYDVRNRIKTIVGNDKATTYDYDALGRRTNAVWPNDTTATYTYDAANQLLSLVHASATSTIASFIYGYDLGGNRTNMITLEGENSYGYDARNWLTFAVYPDGSSQEFEYDGVGNRTELIASAPTSVPSVVQTAYTYGPANRLLSSTSATETNAYAYDGAGRLTNQLVSGIARHFGYSYRGQMTMLEDINGSVFAYAFDGDRNRISQSLNDCLTSRFVYDGPNVVLDLNGSNEVVHAYVNGLGIDDPIERIAFIAETARLRQVYHADALGSVSAMTDEAGAAVKTYSYKAFGRIRAETGVVLLNRVTYTGREALGDSAGWYFYRNRVLDPITGRFTSGDTLGFSDGANIYSYATVRPLLFADPYGLAVFRCRNGKCSDYIPKPPPEPAPPSPPPDKGRPHDPTFMRCFTQCFVGPDAPDLDYPTPKCPWLGKTIKYGGKAWTVGTAAYCIYKCREYADDPMPFDIGDLYPPSS